MALTGLKIKTNIDDVDQRILISTDEALGENGETILQVAVLHCDKNWNTKGDRLQYYRIESEEEFHTALRKDSAEKGHLITQMSTNPEWNPEGYIKLDDEFKNADPADAFNKVIDNFKDK